MTNLKYLIVVLVFSSVYFYTCNCADNEVKKYIYEVKQQQMPVDHFNFLNNNSFQLRYLYNDSFVRTPATAPLFFYTGNEGDIELFAQNTGFLWELAEEFNAGVVFAEHRYYGKSIPFGNVTKDIGYLSVEQTLEDFATLIDLVWGNKNGPVIVFGGSYGGMLSAWLRMKYPHLVAGALAASAPIRQFHDIVPCDIFFKITTSVFTTSYSSNCSTNIKMSWDLLKKHSTTDDGRKALNELFKFCDPMTQEKDIDKFFDYLEDVYGNLAMANYPYANDFLSPLPGYPVRQFCFHLKDLQTEANLLTAMYKAISVYTNYTGTLKCLDYKNSYGPTLGGDAWDVQICNQLVLPMCSSTKDTMFRDKQWDFKSYSKDCFNKFQITPRLDDMILRYGGKNLRATSNIIFSNGLLDPWSGGGVLQSDNDNIYIVLIPEGAHHIDLRASTNEDPPSVKAARELEKHIISNWIRDY